MLNWYVMRAKPNKEALLYEQLCLRQMVAYCPHIRVQPANPRALKVKPYFPGYLFVQVNLGLVGISALQWIPGAAGLVSFGGEPAALDDVLLQAIRRNVERINAAGNASAMELSRGDPVTILSGPFAGYRAIFDECLQGGERVRVLLQLLHDRQVGIELPAGLVTHQTASI
jgi:transcriptional antiterminator RfaH